MTKKRKFSQLLMALALGLSIISFTTESADAARVDEVLVSYITHTDFLPWYQYTYGHSYKDLRYINGYTATEKTERISWYFAAYDKTLHTFTYYTY